MKRRKIDTRAISPRRPSLTLTRDIDLFDFTSSLTSFADEYLRAALELTVTGDAFGTLHLSLEDTAYALRLMVEYGGESSVLKSTLTKGELLTLDTLFPDGLPSISDIAKIKAASDSAGFHFELRGNRIILRARIYKTGKIPVYAKDINIFRDILYDMFFEI